jgi:hypothetical protein
MTTNAPWLHEVIMNLGNETLQLILVLSNSASKGFLWEMQRLKRNSLKRFHPGHPGRGTTHAFYTRDNSDQFSIRENKMTILFKNILYYLPCLRWIRIILLPNNKKEEKLVTTSSQPLFHLFFFSFWVGKQKFPQALNTNEVPGSADRNNIY